MKLIDLYSWLKIFHILALIAWMAGIFYLPRLFVYHADAVIGSDKSETFKIMERRLLKAITTPAMIATWIFGLWVALEGGWLTHGTLWLHIKIAFVIALSAFHGLCAKWTAEFAKDRNVRSARFYRIANEVPTLLLIVIVILAVAKPI